MEKEGFEGISPIEDIDPFNAALKHFDDCSDLFYRVTEAWVRSPNTKLESDYEKADELIRKAFYDVTSVIAHDYTTEVPERATLLASLLNNSDAARVENLNRIAPAGNFIEPVNDLSELTEAIESDFYNENGDQAEPQDICNRLLKRFVDDHERDLNWLKSNIKPIQGGKTKLFGYTLGHHLFDVGKIAAGALIAATVYDLLKKES